VYATVQLYLCVLCLHTAVRMSRPAVLDLWRHC